MRLYIFSAGLLLLLLLLWPAALLWRRYYSDDTHNLARRLFKNSAVPFALRIIVRALDLIFAVILYSLLPADEFGRYEFGALLVVQYIGTFIEFGLGTLLTREVAREPGAAQRLFSAALLLRLLLVCAAVPATALLIGVYELLGRLGLGEAIK